MNKLSNSAMLLDIENFLKQEIADKIKTCASRIEILSISCIDQQWSQPVSENGFAIDDEDDDFDGFKVDLDSIEDINSDNTEEEDDDITSLFDSMFDD